MSWATSEIVAVLTFLLPGFVGVIVFYALTSYPKPNDLERIVQALAFTIASQAVASVVVYFLDLSWSKTTWPELAETVIPFGIALGLGLITAVAVNHDFPHGILRRLKITRETSYPSEWYGAFADNEWHYVVLHFKNGNRLYGWPEEVPSRPDQGHFVLFECEWLIDDERHPLPETSVLVVPAQDVNMVELVQGEESEVKEED